MKELCAAGSGGGGEEDCGEGPEGEGECDALGFVSIWDW